MKHTFILKIKSFDLNISLKFFLGRNTECIANDGEWKLVLDQYEVPIFPNDLESSGVQL